MQDRDGVQHIMAPRNVLALHLDECGHGHGGGGEDEADADALEVGDAAGVAGEAAGEGNEEAVVDRDDDDHEGDGDDGKGSRWDGEAPDLGVHGDALLYGEGLELG